MNNELHNQVKLIAFHLPQFHTFPENDEWWGNGFTEWTNVKKAKPLYKGHYQPHVPINNNYYDLSNRDAMLEQMKLAKKYGVYGFCYYHYWFDGKLLMEKPLETIRDYTGEKLNYCLCWANEPWTRSWDGAEHKVLMAQSYGNELEWEEHFQYLLTYFNDEYYIKCDDKPMLVIYRCNNIPRCDEMIKYWNERCKQYGFKGIYLVEEVNTFQDKPVCKNSEAYVEFEPMYTTNHDRTFIDKIIDKSTTVLFNFFTSNQCTHVYRYNRVWNRIVKRSNSLSKEKDRIIGGFVEWDNTPRRGKESIFYRGATPRKFEKYLRRQITNSNKLGCSYLFLNAWNEWGEGAYLEPDSKNGYGYLESIKKLIFSKE